MAGSRVIVVGAGNAALTAAVAAHTAGAEVRIIEKAPHAERGGNSRFSGGVFRFAYDDRSDLERLVRCPPPQPVHVEPYQASEYHRDLLATSGGLADLQLTRVLAEESLPTIHWMKSLGVKWEYSEIFRTDVDGVIHYQPGAVIQTVGAGVGLTDALFRAVEARGIPIHYEAPMEHLVMNGTRVVGVVVGGNHAGTCSADAVILAAGGFEANPDLRQRHLGPTWTGVKVRGSRFDTGEVLQTALEVGAQPFGEWAGCHATPIDATAPATGELWLTDRTNRLSYPFGITVNQCGRRFVDEGKEEASHTYARMGREILAQPGGNAYQLFDQKTLPLLEERYASASPREASTLEELAVKLGIPVAPFVETITQFNSSINDRPFNPGILDGKATSGLRIDKSNWAVPLSTPPYVAYAVTCGITFTYGGLRTDIRAKVLDSAGEPIAGLFATGEITGGFFYGNYAGGAGLMRGAVYGRIAGREAAALRWN